MPDEYARRLEELLAQFPPMADEARRRLVQLYETIEVTEEPAAEAA